MVVLTKEETIKGKEIRVDLAGSCRARLDERNIKRLMEILQEYGRFDPVGLNQNRNLLDGIHRVEAYKRAYQDRFDELDIPCYYKNIPDDEVASEGYRINAKQGTQPTQEDTRKMVGILHDAGLSDDAIKTKLILTSSLLQSAYQRSNEVRRQENIRRQSTKSLDSIVFGNKRTGIRPSPESMKEAFQMVIGYLRFETHPQNVKDDVWAQLGEIRVLIEAAFRAKAEYETTKRRLWQEQREAMGD